MSTTFNELLDKKYFCLLNSGNKNQLYAAYSNSNDIFSSLSQIELGKKYFGYISYDYKNKIEELQSQNTDNLCFDDILLFEPESCSLLQSSLDSMPVKKSHRLNVLQKVDKKKYIETINHIQTHIKKGDVYELNYCIEFYAENANISPIEVYNNLNAISKAPFAALCKFDDKYIISSSPERFIKKEGNKIISQPIKGTARRGANNKEDQNEIDKLKNSIKEKTENVMIVDLVRNDLSKIAKKASVKVDELFGVYSFEQVHQMISTISCELDNKYSFKDIIHALFPMGSMTGAPKVKSMQLIEQYEKTKRSVYSGAVGYIAENGDFDFNVVIRTILYNATNKYLSFMVGSAITALSNPEEEYEECMLKAKAMIEVLS